MGKDAASRRAWVKNVAIIFLVVLLLLTFFSNTILNYSLPEVSAQYAKYGSISNAIKLNGTVKANENYSVVYDELANVESGTETTTQTRKVVSVYVKEGDTVELGAPIMALQGGASEELKAAEEKLLELERTYELDQLNDKVDSYDADAAISTAEEALEDAKKQLAQVNELYNSIANGNGTSEWLAAQEKNLKKIQADLKAELLPGNEGGKALGKTISDLESKIEAEKNNIEDDFSGVSLADRLRLAKEEYADLELQYYALKDAADAAKQTLEDLQDSSGNMSSASEISQNIKTLEAQIDSLEKTVTRAREDFADTLKKTARSTPKTPYTNIINDYEDSSGSSDGSEDDSTEAASYGITSYGAEESDEILITAYIQDLPSSVWTDLEKIVIRAYDWDDIVSQFESTLKKQLRANGVDTTNETVLLEIEEYIDNIEASAKAHKRSIEDYDDEINEASRKLTEEKEKLRILGIDSTDEIKDYTISLEIEVAQKEYDKTKAEFDEITEQYNTAKVNLEGLDKQNQSAEKIAEYEKQLDVYKAEAAILEEQLNDVNDELELIANIGEVSPEDAQKAVESAEKALEKAKAKNNYDTVDIKYKREAQLKEIEELKAKIEAYKNAPETTDITAPIAGRIINVNYVPGNSVTSGDTVAQIEISDKGYVCEISLASEEARKVQVGATCTITNSWWYSNLEAKVTQIRSDPQSQGKNRIIVIEVKGDVYDGQSLTFSIGDKSQSYDAVLPNSAIREDSDGKFVLTVESKKTPLGVRYTAVRYDVEIIASDDTQSAVSGLYGNEFVIINATSPVSDGQQVRLAEN